MTTQASQQRHILDPDILGDPTANPISGDHILNPDIPGALEVVPGSNHILDIPEAPSNERNVLDTPEVQHTNPFADLPTGSAPAVEQAAQAHLSGDSVADELMAQTSESVNPTLNVVDEAAQAHENQSVQNVFAETAQAVDARDIFSQVGNEQDGFTVQLDLQEQIRSQEPINRVIIEAAENYKESANSERRDTNGAKALVANAAPAPLPTTPTPAKRGRGGANMRRR